MSVEINPLDLATEDVSPEDRETRPTVEVMRSLEEDDRARAEVRVSARREAEAIRPRAVRASRHGAVPRRVVRDMSSPSARQDSTASRAARAYGPLAAEALRGLRVTAMRQALGAALIVVNLSRIPGALFRRNRRKAQLRGALRACAFGALLVSMD